MMGVESANIISMIYVILISKEKYIAFLSIGKVNAP